MSEILINGEPAELQGEHLAALLRHRGIDPSTRGIAVAVNGAVVPRARWAETAIGAGDRIDIVRAFAGG
ncbi:MAG TPA: sulfur carrier protein ThiS [Alphaproteobacteria bacterium]